MIAHKICQFLCLSSQNKKVIFGSLGVIFLFCLREGVILGGDSGTYINLSAIRIGLYPLTILLFQTIFKEHALQALVVFQLGFAITASYQLATFLRSIFNLPPLMHWVLIATLLSPIVVFKSANEIMSEGLAYPLFLVSSYFLLKGVVYKNIKCLLAFSFSIFLLSFTRQQYLFFYVVGFVSFLFLFFFAKDFQKNTPYLLSIFLSLGSFFLAERSYHLLFHHSFAQTPFIGCQFIVRPLFLATEDSYKDFTNPSERRHIKETVDEILEKEILAKDPKHRGADHYSVYFTPIAKIFVESIDKIWRPEYKGYANFKYTQAIDHQVTSMALTLIAHNFLNYIKSYAKDIIHGFGGYVYFNFSLFLAISFLFRILLLNERNPFLISFILAALIHFGNLAVICLFEPPLTRYTYSTSALLGSLIFIIGYQYIKFLTLINRSDMEKKSNDHRS